MRVADQESCSRLIHVFLSTLEVHSMGQERTSSTMQQPWQAQCHNPGSLPDHPLTVAKVSSGAAPERLSFACSVGAAVAAVESTIAPTVRLVSGSEVWLKRLWCYNKTLAAGRGWRWW